MQNLKVLHSGGRADRTSEFLCRCLERNGAENGNHWVRTGEYRRTNARCPASSTEDRGRKAGPVGAPEPVRFYQSHVAGTTRVASPTCQRLPMLRVIGAIVFLVLAFTVAMLATERLPEGYATAVALLLPLIGFVAAWWAIALDRKRRL